MLVELELSKDSWTMSNGRQRENSLAVTPNLSQSKWHKSIWQRCTFSTSDQHMRTYDMLVPAGEKADLRIVSALRETRIFLKMQLLWTSCNLVTTRTQIGSGSDDCNSEL